MAVKTGLGPLAAALGTALALTAAPATALAAGKSKSLREAGFFDPRSRQLPPTHRFRMGLALYYIRLSAAVEPTTGETQRFHYIPLGLSFAYQAQFLKRMMVRPEVVIGGNVGNTGNGQGHSHTFKNLNLTPPYFEIIWIIRVK